MKKLAIAGLTMLFVGVSAMSAFADKIPSQGPPTNPTDSPGQCPTTGYKSINSGIIMPDVTSEPAAERTVEELLACFEEPETLVDVSAEDLKVCLGGER